MQCYKGLDNSIVPVQNKVHLATICVPQIRVRASSMGSEVEAPLVHGTAPCGSRVLPSASSLHLFGHVIHAF